MTGLFPRTPAFDIVCNMERPLRDLTAYAHAVALAADSLDDDDGLAVSTLAFAMKKMAEDIEEERGKLFHLLHPNAEHRTAV
jgi:hypothetical protein